MVILKYILFLLSLSAILYYLYSLIAVLDFFNQSTEIDTNFQPPITILKPLAGSTSEIKTNLTSFCQQDYPPYQIIFCLQNQQDSSKVIVEELINQFPHLDLSLVISDRNIGTNPKINNIANGLNVAKYDILVLADSDIKVNQDYLKNIIQPLKDESVGLVTCLYNSVGRNWLAAFEALEISTQFNGRVLLARKLEGIKFAFGSTIVIRRDILDKIGGFAAVANYLADDYQLGNLVNQTGYKVTISNYIVEHCLEEVTISEFIHRQTRWAKCIKVERFWGYLGLIFTQGTTTSLLFLILTMGSKLGWIVFILTWSIRLLTAGIISIKKFQDSIAQKYLFWIFLRDIISSLIWFYSLFGNQIIWRGYKLKLIKGGKLV